MIRATTGGVLRGYRSNLMNSFITLNNARNTMLTQRNFNSYAEDPAAASKSFQLRRARMATQSQYNICDDTYRKYQQGVSALQSVNQMIATENGSELATLKDAALRVLNDPSGDARAALSKTLSQISDTIIQSMNTKYGDNFVFAGADGQNVPFEIVDNKLYYRGIPVDAQVPKVTLDAGNNNAQYTVDAAGNIDPNGQYYIQADSVSAIDAAEFDAMDPADQPQVLRDASGAAVKVDADGNIDPNGAFYLNTTNLKTVSQEDYETCQKDLAKLEYLADEKYFVDIGLGFKENIKGELIEASGFNAALNGLTYLGYGVDEDGDPKNIYSIVQKLSDIAARAQDRPWTEADYNEFYELTGKLEDHSSEFNTQFINTDASTTKLKNNLELLEESFYTLQEQYSELEDVDMADAITSLIWAQYCYNAALKVGNSILSESLIDYLN
jgi:flagellar hook-associated protein 3 FlgL